MNAYEVISPAPRDVWTTLYQSDPHAIPYQSPDWFAAVLEMGNYADASRLYQTTDGRCFVLPMVRSRFPSGPLATQASLPHGWGMGGLLASAPLIEQDMQLVINDLARTAAMRTIIRPNPLHGKLWTAAKTPGVVAIPRLAHVLDLDGGSEVVWSKRFSTNTRNMLRKAQKNNIDVECDSSGRLVSVFYDLLTLSVDRWAKQQHEPLALSRIRSQNSDPIRKFEVIAEKMGSACKIWVARIEGQPAAAVIVLHGTNTNYSRGAMNKELVGSSRANELLQWMAIEEACKAGARYYHMGESGTSVALAQFKGKFGAEAVSYEELRLERLPITKVDRLLRDTIKRVIGFKDYRGEDTEKH